jgi:hypothetical protein
MKRFIIGALLALQAISYGQSRYHTLQEIKESSERYFENQRKTNGDAFLEAEGSEYNEYRRWLHLWEQRIKPNETIFDYIEKISTVSGTSNSQGKTSSVAGINDPWVELGPTDVPPTGETTIGSPGGSRGVGPIQYLVFYKSNPDIMLASSLAGGLFYTTNKGLSWQNAGSDKWTISGCTSMDFSSTSSTTWYACSNLGGNNNRHGAEANFAIGPGGVWRTVNSGASYDLIGDQYDFTTLGSTTTIHKILVDPNNGDVAYLATTGGLYKTVNLTSANPTWFTIQTGNIEDVEFASNSSSVIYISRQQTFAPAANGWNQTNDWVFETSTNWTGTSTTGGTWSTITPPSGGFVANQSTGGTEPGNIEITNTEADPNLLYLTDLKNVGSTFKLYTYNVVTGVWTLRRTATNSTYGIGRALAVSNVNAANICIGLTSGFQGVMYTSSDYGATVSFVDPAGASTPYHVDVEYIVAPPYNSLLANGTEVFMCTHGGVSFSSNWMTTINHRTNGLGVAEIWGFSQTDADPEKIVMGLDHDGSVMSAGTGAYPSLSWETVYGGDGLQPFVDNTVADNVFVATLSSTAYRISTSGGHAYSYSYWNGAQPNIVQNLANPNYIYYRKTIGGFTQVFRSSDHGLTVDEQISNFGSPYTSTGIQEIATSPTNPNYVYIDLLPNGSSHAIARTTIANGPAASVQSSWQILTSPFSGGMGPAVVDLYDPNIIYFTQYGCRVYKADYTNPTSPVFTDISSNLPWVNFPNRLLLERGSDRALYLAAGTSVWYTNESKLASSPTNAWEKFTELPNTPLNGLAINYKNNKLRAATCGRGVWEHDLICPQNSNITFAGPSMSPAFYEASNILAYNTAVSSGGPKILRATDYVLFNPGFVATGGTGNNDYVHAFIHGCHTPGNSFKPEDGPIAILGDEEENEEDNYNPLEIFPNPHDGNFTVRLPKKETTTIYLFDVTGRIVFFKNDIREDQIQINATDLPKGIYLIKAETADRFWTKKIIKNN